MSLMETYSPSFQPFPLHLSLNSNSGSSNGESSTGSCCYADEEATAAVTRSCTPNVASAPTTTQLQQQQQQTVTAFGSAMASTSTPQTDIGKLSYYLKCCVLGCGMPCRNGGAGPGYAPTGSSPGMISFDLFDYEAYADQQRLTHEQEELIFRLVTQGDFMLDNVLEQHYILVDDKHTILPKHSNNIFINVPSTTASSSATATAADGSNSSKCTPATTTSIMSMLMKMSSSADHIHQLRQRQQVMLCTNDWINEYYVLPILGYMNHRKDRLVEQRQRLSQQRERLLRRRQRREERRQQQRQERQQQQQQQLLTFEQLQHELQLLLQQEPDIPSALAAAAAALLQQQQQREQRQQQQQGQQGGSPVTSTTSSTTTPTASPPPPQQQQQERERRQQQQPRNRHQRSSSSAPFHSNIQCDNCMSHGIRGARYRCITVHDYDLCEFCFYNGNHDMDTMLVFERIASPGATPETLGGAGSSSSSAESSHQDEDNDNSSNNKKRSYGDMIQQVYGTSTDDDTIPLVEAVPLQEASSVEVPTNDDATKESPRESNKRRRRLSDCKISVVGCEGNDDCSSTKAAAAAVASATTSTNSNTTPVKEDTSSWFLPGQLVRLVDLPPSCDIVNNCLGTVHERHVNGSVVVHVKKELEPPKRRSSKAAKNVKYAIYQLSVKHTNLIIVA